MTRLECYADGQDMLRSIAVGVSSLLTLLACNGISTSSSTSNTGGTDVTDASAGAGNHGHGGANTDASPAGGSAGAPTLCPPSPPVNGTPCTTPWTSHDFTQVVAHCTYGDDPRPDCRTRALCAEGMWSVGSPSDPSNIDRCSQPAMDPRCPAVPPWGSDPVCGSSSSETDASLFDEQFDCWYPDVQMCRCTNFYPIGGGEWFDPPQWMCWKREDGCPSTLPQAGTPCDLAAGTSCTIWQCTVMPTVRCGEAGQAGPRVWEWIWEYCPVCAAPNTPIATPSGDRPIADLALGDLVYTVDHGAIVAAPIVRIRRTPVHAHRVMRVRLESGATLEISPGHPTADGRPFGTLEAGSRLDPEHTVISAELVPYPFDATYDVLPASSTGTYFAAGAQIGSTLFELPARETSVQCDE